MQFQIKKEILHVKNPLSRLIVLQNISKYFFYYKHMSLMCQQFFAKQNHLDYIKFCCKNKKNPI